MNSTAVISATWPRKTYCGLGGRFCGSTKRAFWPGTRLIRVTMNFTGSGIWNVVSWLMPAEDGRRGLCAVFQLAPIDLHHLEFITIGNIILRATTAAWSSSQTRYYPVVGPES